MRLDRRDLVGGGIVLLTVLVSALAYPELPERVAIHFGSGGEPDNFVSKPLGVAIVPTVAAGIVVLFKLLPALDPLGENFEEFSFYYDLTAVAVVGLLAYVQGLLLAWNLDYAVDVTRALVPVLAVLFYVVGVVVENARQNWFVGIRTPWTLSSEAVWDRTHQRSGVLFKLVGVVALLAIPFPAYFELLVVGPVALVALATTVYSYVLYRRIEHA